MEGRNDQSPLKDWLTDGNQLPKNLCGPVWPLCVTDAVILKTYVSCLHTDETGPSHILWSNQQWLISSTYGPAAATRVIPIHLRLQYLWRRSISPPVAPRAGNIIPELWLPPAALAHFTLQWYFKGRNITVCGVTSSHFPPRTCTCFLMCE